MVTISLTNQQLLATKAIAKAVILEQDFNHSVLNHFSELFPAINALVKERGFNGSLLSHVTIPYAHKEQNNYLILIGIGKKVDGKMGH